jgi:hypothetical protein
MAEIDDAILYVSPDTYDRLLANERIVVRPVPGLSKAAFLNNDHRYPNIPLQTSRQVTGNAVHRKVWVPAEERFVFEFVGDV